MRRMLWLIPVVLVFVAGGIGLFSARPEAEIGAPAPDFQLPALSGRGNIALSDLRGKPVVINFWASWCEPCKQEASEFARTARLYGARVNFLGITMLDARDPALAFVKLRKIPYPSARDTRGVVAKRYGVTGVPETAFLDPEGRLVGKYIGAFTAGGLENVVRNLLVLQSGHRLRLAGRGDTLPIP